ncbi:cell cycle control protein tyrosine phosphatase [Niveomyces insectorum RCEF 264]|uniref:M-phase inducer phosphatase n=1 Tax=Niveomyces insectorum RCEF 264 TaxID=1081102 RepID=A0A162JCY6_9HYPO|nr:cell cycle control protein tyrosine phosphatase [Niveomyces insectorum RCEF 264]
METSSPLAAMHRPAAPFGRRDLFTNVRVRLSPGKPRCGGRGNERGNERGGPSGGSGGGVFSIRDQLNQNYFSMKPIHGSSPAGSLAADLCQNFTIGDDASPRFPTPRRALFTSSQTTAAENNRGFLKAPPLPVSSSPLPLDELMDMTPVPKKAAFVTEIEIPPSSPSLPSSSPGDQMMLESPCPGPQPAAHEPLRPSSSSFERRKFPRRASLTRAKGFSFAGPSGRYAADNQLPFFHFGASRLPPAAPTPPSLSASDLFQDSPSPPPPAAQPFVERRPQTANSPCASAAAAAAGGPVRSRPLFVSTNSASAALGAAAASASASRTGSPIPAYGQGHGHGHVRRPSSSFARPRRQYRRSLSMFENPVDVMKPKRDDPAVLGSAAAPTLQPSLLASVMDTEELAPCSEPASPVLPHFFPEGQNDSIPRIDRATLLRVLDGQFNDAFEHKLIIDCRFEYEYDGGHINAAINYNDKDLLTSHLFRNPPAGRTLIVLHCEYSAHRAPLMARHIRAEDRALNAEHYPHLTYPELYILAGGYSGFFGEHPSRCYPQAYVEMDAAEHAFTCEREMDRLRQNRKGLHRAQTFAFGQRDQEKNAAAQHKPLAHFADMSSPIALGRPIDTTAQDSSPCMMMGASPILGSDRGHARRMASY